MKIMDHIKGDVYKTVCRKNSFVIFLPCLIPILVGILGRTGSLILTTDTSVEGHLSCMEFINVCWRLISGIYVMNIIAILLGVFGISKEMEEGQIRNAVIRANHRSYVILSKITTLFLQILILIVSFVLISIFSYYGLFKGTSYATGTFVKYDIFNIGSFTLYFFASALRMLILILVTFLLGLKLKPFTCFILTFFLSIGIRNSGMISFVPLYKVSPDYLLSRIDCFVSPTISNYIDVLILLGYILFFTIATILIFRKMDVK